MEKMITLVLTPDQFDYILESVSDFRSPSERDEDINQEVLELLWNAEEEYKE